MVWYIRFLKTPKFYQESSVRALITVTTDLGDAFYPRDLTLYAMIVTESEENWMSEWQSVKWKNGMRSLWINIDRLNTSTRVDLRLVVNAEQSKEASSVSLENIPEVLGVWSDTFDWVENIASNMVERRYRTQYGREMAIFEETGESIARHIWDAGIAMTAFLNALASEPRATSDLAKLIQSTTRCGLRILELGSGCGIVGLQISDICSTSDVLLTDLPQAMDILDYNVEHAKYESSRARLTTAVLNWDRPLPQVVADQPKDVVVLADCTYNPDSIPGLVKTLRSVAEISPDVLTVVSLKWRHDSEAMFFDLMAAAGFVESEYIAIPLPDQHKKETGQELEVVEIHTYRRREVN